jgi:hypothetical protein
MDFDASTEDDFRGITDVELCGGRAPIAHAPSRAGEILKSRARVDRLRDVFGVVAETRLADGLRATLG